MNIFNKTDSNKGWILIAMTGSLAMIMLDQTIIAVTLPRIEKTYNLSPQDIPWIINSYMLAIISLIAVGGKIGDLVGRVKAFIFGIILFVASSVMCGLAPTFYILIISRIFQGIGAAFMQPASVAIVNDSFPLNERGKAIAVYAGTAMLFMAIGPILGGFLTEYFSWRSAFFINFVIGALTIFLTLVIKPKDKVFNKQSIDIVELLLLAGGVFLLVLGIQQGDIWNWTSVTIMSLISSGVLLLIFFVIYELNKKFPLFHLQLFKKENFGADLIILFCIQLALMGQNVLIPTYLQNILGFSSFKTGILMLFNIVPVAIVAHFSGRIFDKIGAKPPVIIGLLLLIIGTFYKASILEYENINLIIPGMILVGTSVGFIIFPLKVDALNRAPYLIRGETSGLILTVRQLGTIIGITGMTAFFSRIKSNEIANVISNYSIKPENSVYFKKLLSKSHEAQVKIVSNYSDSPEIIINKLKYIFSSSLSTVYYSCGIVVIFALIVTIFIMKFGKNLESDSQSNIDNISNN